MTLIESVAGPILRNLAPETAHHLALRALEAGIAIPRVTAPDPVLATQIAGLSLSSPLGLAAGFDKNARAVPALGRLGFSHVEIGTVTPKPQPGNLRPRVFRLPAQQALINRLGFPSDGIEAVADRLAKRPEGLTLGANVGCNRVTADPIGDITTGIRRLASLVDYVCVNVSSPNTHGLRDLQTGTALDHLLSRVRKAREDVEDKIGRRLPVFLKIAPDLNPAAVRHLVDRVIRQPVDALVVSNTTIARPATLTGPHRGEIGGLSGPPLFEPSTRLLATLYGLLPRTIGLVGVGGISSALDAWRKIEAGASLIQLYTGFVYHGSQLVEEIHTGLVRHLQESGYGSVSSAVGRRSQVLRKERPRD